MDKDFVNLLMNRSLYKDLNSETFQQWERRVINSERFQQWEKHVLKPGRLQQLWPCENHAAMTSGIYHHWEENINPDKPICPCLEEMWQMFDKGDSVIEKFLGKIGSYLKQKVRECNIYEVIPWQWLRGTTLYNDDYLKYILIKSTNISLFDCFKNLDPKTANFLHLAWQNYLREKINNCYDDYECKTRMVNHSIKQICRTLLHIVVEPSKFGLKTTTISLKGVNLPVTIVIDLEQLALEYYGPEESCKTVGEGENIDSGAWTGFAFGGPIGAAAGGMGGFCLWGVGEATDEKGS